MYFQAIEEDSPVIYFYKLIPTSTDETAEGFYKSLRNAIVDEERDLFSYLKNNLVGYGSDGASVMLGKYGGLAVVLEREMTRRTLYKVYCMAHKLHLAITNAYKKHSFFAEMEKFLNNIYTFYNNAGHKRKAHLRETSARIGRKMYELNYIFKSRWIASELTAMNNIKEMWLVLVTDLKKISEDKEFKAHTRELARELREILIGRNFLLIFHFVLDILQHLSIWSKRMQQIHGLLINFAKFNDDITSTFNTLKSEDGHDLVYFLLETQCTLYGKKFSEKCQTVENYQDALKITFNDVELVEDHRTYQVPWLHMIRDSFIDDMIAQIQLYFPSGQLKDFDIFEPSNIPNTAAAVKEKFTLCVKFLNGKIVEFWETNGRVYWKRSLIAIGIVNFINLMPYRSGHNF